MATHPMPLVTHCEPLLPETQTRAHEEGLAETGHQEAYLAKTYALLTLTEQQLHGPLGPSSAHLRAQLAERRQRLAEIAEDAGDTAVTPAALPSHSAWQFHWRRAAVALIVAGLAGAIGQWGGVLDTTIGIALALLAALAILGPWPIGRTFLATLAVVHQARLRWTRARQCRRLRAGIRSLQAQLDTAETRRDRAATWLEPRVDLLRAEYDVHRLRAARAAARLKDPMPRRHPVAVSGGSHDTVRCTA